MDKIRGYLYTIGQDYTVNVQEGYFEPGYHRWSRQGRFIPDNGKWCYIPNEPGMFYHRKMWLVKRDDEFATRLYVEYHEQKIKECERNIAAHKKAIAVLKGETNNECI